MPVKACQYYLTQLFMGSFLIWGKGPPVSIPVIQNTRPPTVNRHQPPGAPNRHSFLVSPTIMAQKAPFPLLLKHPESGSAQWRWTLSSVSGARCTFYLATGGTICGIISKTGKSADIGMLTSPRLSALFLGFPCVGRIMAGPTGYAIGRLGRGRTHMMAISRVQPFWVVSGCGRRGH